MQIRNSTGEVILMTKWDWTKKIFVIKNSAVQKREEDVDSNLKKFGWKIERENLEVRREKLRPGRLSVCNVCKPGKKEEDGGYRRTGGECQWLRSSSWFVSCLLSHWQEDAKLSTCRFDAHLAVTHGRVANTTSTPTSGGQIDCFARDAPRSCLAVRCRTNRFLIAKNKLRAMGKKVQLTGLEIWLWLLKLIAVLLIVAILNFIKSVRSRILRLIDVT